MSQHDGNPNELEDRGGMDQLSAHLDRGWDLIHRGDISGARKSAEKSLEIDAEAPEAHNLLGYVCAVQGDHEQALESYRQAIALDESFIEAMLNAAEVLIHPVHDFDAALALIDEALEWTETDEEKTDALLLKFDAYAHRGDDESAKRVLRRLPDLEGAGERLSFLVGRAHFEVGEVKDARKKLERAVKLEPSHADAHYYLAMALDADDAHDLATLEFLRCRELDAAAPRPPWALPTSQFERKVRGAIENLEPPLRDVLEDALVVVVDVPGAEVVAEGVDPRAPALIDVRNQESNPARAGRVFVYQRNVERQCDVNANVEDELRELIGSEIVVAFPSLAPPERASAPSDASDCD